MNVQKKKVKTTDITNLPGHLNLAVSEKHALEPVLAPITSQDKISYASSDEKVATVTKSGVIKAHQVGTARITVTAGKKKAVCTVKVKGVETVAILGIPESSTLKKGKKLHLKALVQPVSSQEKVTYKSSNKKVATVNAKGVVTAKKKGTTTITVKSGSVKVKCKVKVK